MNSISKTLYIPLYGKAAVSRKGILLHDPKAEAIWEQEGFALRGKAKSKWLTYSMGMRSAVFDRWLVQQMAHAPNAPVLHLGCGMDSRVERVPCDDRLWFDVDLPDVIAERQKYYAERANYHMLSADLRNPSWLEALPSASHAIVVMEGVSMYLPREALLGLLTALAGHFSAVSLLMDVYTVWAAKASKYKNPINEVGVRQLYGVDDPQELTAGTGLSLVGEHSLTPPELIEELQGFERWFFRLMFAGKASHAIYRLYEYGGSACEAGA